jgi:hypothetical protein
MGGPRHARTRLDGVPSVERGTLLAIPRDRRAGSKVEGAAWLERRDPDPDTRALLDAALAYQRGGIPDQPDERTVSGFVERVEAMLRGAVS